MKKVILKNVFVILIFSLLTGCSKDDNPTNTPTEVIKTKVKITKIDISSIRANNGSLPWDTFDNPDVFIKCYDELNTLITSSTTLWNYVPTINAPITVNFSSPMIATDLLNTVLKVQVWDDDSDLTSNPNDLIGEVPFTIHDYIIGSNKYPSYAVKNDGNGTVVTIYMTWE